MIRETTYDEVFDAQTHFRLIMDSMARPGKINVLNGVTIHPPHTLNRASAVIGLALLNADVSYFSSQNAEEVAAYFIINTASQEAAATDADFLFLNGLDEPQTLEKAKVGTLTYPDTNAFIILDVASISDELQEGLALTLSGPGVNGTKTVFVAGLNTDLLDTLQDINAEYPLGLDTILTDSNDRIIGIPRSTKVSYTRQENA